MGVGEGEAGVDLQGLAAWPSRCAGRAGTLTTRSWPTHHESVHFYGTHSVDADGELAKLDADGYRPLRTSAASELAG